MLPLSKVVQAAGQRDSGRPGRLWHSLALALGP